MLQKISKCDNTINSFKKECSNCNKAIKTKYTCINKECETRVYEKYTPGGKESVGKLLDVCRALHAEENAIVNAAKSGALSLEGKTLYSTTFPCKLCANKIVQAGISEVIYSEPYTMPEAKLILEHKKIKIRKFEGVKSSAFFRLYD